MDNKWIRSFLYDFPLKKKIIAFFMVLIVLTVTLITIVATVISGSYIENIEEQNQVNRVITMNRIIDFNHEVYMRKAGELFANVKLQETLVKDYQDMYDVVIGIEDITKIFDSITFDVGYSGYRYISLRYEYDQIKLQVYTNNESFTPNEINVFDINAYKDEEWVQETLDHDRVVRNIVRGQEGKDFMIVSRKLINFRTQEPIGIIVIQVPLSIMEFMLLEYRGDESEFVAYYDDKDHLVAATDGTDQEALNVIQDYVDSGDKEVVQKLRVNNQNYIISSVRSKTTGWLLVSMIPLKSIVKGANIIKIYAILVGVMALLISIMAATKLSRVVTRRLRQLVDKMDSVKEDYKTSLAIIEGEDEVGHLDKTFNEMVLKINDLIEREYKMQILRDNVKLELLQEQINPHLLYNTLSSIGWNAKKSGAMEVFEVTNSLIRFYRTSLNRGEFIISFRREVEMTLEYIDIIQYTYKMDFEKVIQIDEQVYQFASIKLILQPIVENALMHGLRYCEKDEKVLKLKCDIKEERIRIQVEDNGVGMSPTEIEELTSGEDHINKGYGLGNVVKRLELLYGKRQKVEITSEEGEGTRITIEIAAMNERSLKTYLDERGLL